MAAPVIDQGAVIGVLVAQLSIEEIDRFVTGGRRWRQEGFGATGEAYLIGPDFTRALRPAPFYRGSRPSISPRPKAKPARRPTRSRTSGATARRCCISASTRRRRARRWRGIEGTGESSAYRGKSRPRLLGAARDFGREMGAGRQDRFVGGLRADLPAGSATS